MGLCWYQVNLQKKVFSALWKHCLDIHSSGEGFKCLWMKKAAAAVILKYFKVFCHFDVDHILNSFRCYLIVLSNKDIYSSKLYMCLRIFQKWLFPPPWCFHFWSNYPEKFGKKPVFFRKVELFSLLMENQKYVVWYMLPTKRSDLAAVAMHEELEFMEVSPQCPIRWERTSTPSLSKKKGSGALASPLASHMAVNAGTKVWDFQTVFTLKRGLWLWFESKWIEPEA